MRILVVGATGGTGREVVRLGTEAGLTMVPMVRKADQADEFTTPQTVVADALDPGQVDTAIVGVDAVICCLGVRLGTTPGRVRSEGTTNLVKALERSGPQRLVAVSTVGVGSTIPLQSRPARWAWPRMVGTERLEEAARAEDAIMSSALDWTLVRPPRLTDSTETADIVVGPSVPTGLRSTLGRAALATVLIQSTVDHAWSRQCVTAVER